MWLFNTGGFESKLIVSRSPGVDNILWIGENYLMLSRSSMLSTPYIELVEVSGENRRVQITKGESTVPDNAYSISKLHGQASIPSFFVGPENCLPSTVPLIVWVHGGPHSCFVDSFMHESTLLMRLGLSFFLGIFIVLLVNKIVVQDMHSLK
jgi:dipeptidyl aminopeptidase/acylaminoacyl peptidase